MKLISLDVYTVVLVVLSTTDEGNWRLPKHLEKSVSLWASVSEQPKQILWWLPMVTVSSTTND